MTLGAREMATAQRNLEVTLTAQDDASAVIDGVAAATSNLGSASRFAGYQMFAAGLILQKLGRGMENIGHIILDQAHTAIQFASDFDYSMRLVQTQAQVTGKQFNWLKDQVLHMSEQVPQTAAQLTQALYDIFSSMDIGSKQAIYLLHEVAKAATAGGADIQDTTRGVISILNAFNLKVSSTGHVLDILTQLTRKSSGTFSEMISAFGNVTSAARITNQSIETVSGAIAFMTLQGRTQAQASISVSRALDQLQKSATKVKSVLGVSVYDASGKFRDLGAIINDMAAKMKGMTDKQRSQAFIDMFGQGSIQANRFFRLAVTNTDLLNKKIEELNHSGGQFKQTWDIMKAAPAVRMQELSNTLHELYITVGTLLLPAFMKLVAWLKSVLQWFNNLSDGTKSFIAKALVIAGVILLVVGHIFVLLGGLALLASLFTFIGGAAAGGLAAGFGMVATIAGVVIVVLLALAAAAYLIYKNWGTIKPVVMEVFDALKQFFNNILSWWGNVEPIIMDRIGKAWDYVKANWIPALEYIWGVIVKVFGEVSKFLSDEWRQLVAWAKQYWPQIHEAIDHVLSAIHGIFMWFVHTGEALWRHWGNTIKAIVKVAWTFIKSTIHFTLKFIEGIIEVITGLIDLNWKTFWDGMGKIASASLGFLGALARLALQGLWIAFKAALRLIVELWKWGWITMINILKAIPGKLVQLGKDVIMGLWHGMQQVWTQVLAWLQEQLNKLPGIFKSLLGIHSPSTKMMVLGRATMQGFRIGMEQEWRNTQKSIDKMSTDLTTRAQVRTGKISTLHAPRTYNVYVGGKVERPEDIAAELDWLTRTRKI